MKSKKRFDEVAAKKMVRRIDLAMLLFFVTSLSIILWLHDTHLAHAENPDIVTDASASGLPTDHRLSSSDFVAGDLIAKKPAASANNSRVTPSQPGQAEWLDILIEKIHLAEASGKTSCPAGDGGRSVGPMQLTKAAVCDVNYYWGTNYSYEDRRDLTCAKQIARLYISMWTSLMREEIAARIYNGGPRGFEKQAAKEYYFDRIKNENL